MSLWKSFVAVFLTVFMAELGDKTQIATMLFSANDGANKLVVFLGASSALIVATAIGVLVGMQLEKFLSPQILRTAAGVGFVLIGVWTIFTK
ncbi:MAG: TMEM165/GDT1 family protein [Pseudanabaenaceae cyanobacterium SKYGB_i_bin29]|nr:TMEM165/GDT1 family protein [Pseudanabaenaceae cyanobacterium SKYG29]MDW8421826.1 TMEM165/GDT1 family protein [Pseudanabaenaceae cyanobacterium SKYGB_i_bin29]